MKSVRFATMNDDLTAVRIDHPIFAHSGAIEEFLLDPLVAMAGARGYDFDNECGSPLNICLRENVLLIAGDKHKIWLHDVVNRQHHVDR